MGTRGRIFTFEEVRESGRPAYFFDYGEALVFRGGQIFDLRDWPEALRTGVSSEPLPAVLLDHPVGIEYGWRHPEACVCGLCGDQAVAERRPGPVADRRRLALAVRPRAGVVAAAPEP